MTEINPPSYQQNGCYTAEQDRNLYSSFVCQEGVCSVSSGDLEVTDGTTGMQVSVAAGCAWVQGDTTAAQGVYYVRNDSAVTLTLAVGGTDDRIDLIVARVYDSQYAGGSDEWLLEVVPGTESVSPTPPAVPDSTLVLAEVYVAASVTVVNPGDITDVRQNMGTCGTKSPETIVYETDGTFEKADYPGMTAVRVRAVGGGGGSGGVTDSSASQAVMSGGGGAGEYAESVLAVDELLASEPVTVGSGGSAGASTGTNGGNGGTSSYGSHVIANGGTGSNGNSSSVNNGGFPPGAGGSGGTGDLLISGGNGMPGTVRSGFPVSTQQGGDSALGLGANPPAAVNATSGIAGGSYGGGASGSQSRDGTGAVTGGAGADGVVIVEVLY